MPSTVVVVCLVLSFSCSDLVRAAEELLNTNRTYAIPAVSDIGSDVKVRVTRSDVRAALGDKVDPGFWPARGKRGNSEEDAPPFWANRGRSLTMADDDDGQGLLQSLLPHIRPGVHHHENERLRRLEPLYADEPHFILLDRRDESEDPPVGSESIMSQDDPFWVARGRRKYDIPYESLTPAMDEDNFWPARGKRPLKSGLRELTSAEEPFWAARGKKGTIKLPDDLRFRRGLLNSLSAEEPFWAARGRRSNKEDLRSRRGLLEALSAEEPFWAARGKRNDENEVGLEKRGLLETLSAEEPFWAARGKKGGGHLEQDLRYRRGLLESSEEPFWAARGKKTWAKLDGARNRRLLLESLSSEEPFWAARGKRGEEKQMDEKRGRRGNLLDSLSAEEPFWAARGRRGLFESLSAEEPFWAARGKKDSKPMASASPEEILSQIRTREINPKIDPWWPVRGKRVVDSDSNPEDESFWHALESRTVNNTKSKSPTS